MVVLDWEKLTEMWSIKENSLAEELSKKMKFRRTPDDDLLDLDDITVQISTASAQVKLTTYMVVMMVEQAEFDDEETNLAEDLAELSKKMNFMKTPDDSLVDLDDITAQVFTAKPECCKSKRAQQGKCCSKDALQCPDQTYNL